MSREIYAPVPSMNRVTSTVEIDHGGTNGTTAPQAVSNLGGLRTSLIGQPNGLAQLDGTGKLSLTSIPSTVSSGPTVIGSVSLMANQVSTYTITNYDNFTAYNLVAVSGTVSRIGATITYTAPAAAGSGGFTINGKAIDVTIIAIEPSKPTITSPTNGATNQNASVSFTSSAFSMVTGSDTHEGSDWQIAADASFSTIVSQVANSATDKTTYTATGLLANTAYYARVRHKGVTYGYGAWSNTTTFSTKTSFYPTTEEAKLVSNLVAYTNTFGYSVDINNAGDLVVVGENNRDTYGQNSGCVQTFARTGSTWSRINTLYSSDITSYDNFGDNLKLSRDGNRLIVSAGGFGATADGKVYIYTRSGNNWIEEYTILGGYNEYTGLYGVECNDDCSILAITNPRFQTVDVDPVYPNKGQVKIYTRSGTTWTLSFTITGPDIAGYFLGLSIALSGDGERLAIGCLLETVGAITTGAIRVYKKEVGTWNLEATLKPNDATYLSNNGSIANSFAIDETGTRIITGNSSSSNGSVTSGVMHVFTRSGTTWAQEASIYPSDPVNGQSFGKAVRTNNIGDKIVTVAGTATDLSKFYLFSRTGVTWTEVTQFNYSDALNGDQPIIADQQLRTTEDFSRIVVGVPQKTITGTVAAGAVYVFS